MNIEIINNNFNDFYINLYRNEKVNEYDYIIFRISDDFFSSVEKIKDVYLLFKIDNETKKYRKYKLLKNLTPLYFLFDDKRNKMEGEKYLSIYFLTHDEFINILDDLLYKYNNNIQLNNTEIIKIQNYIYSFLYDKNSDMKMYVYIKYLY